MNLSLGSTSLEATVTPECLERRFPVASRTDLSLYSSQETGGVTVRAEDEAAEAAEEAEEAETPEADGDEARGCSSSSEQERELEVILRVKTRQEVTQLVRLCCFVIAIFPWANISSEK